MTRFTVPSCVQTPVRRSTAAVGYLVCACLALCGCGWRGPDLCTVSGTVACDGEPLSGQAIIFEPRGGAFPPGATTIQKGAFTLRVARGECLVRIIGILSRNAPAQTQAADVIPGVGVPSQSMENVIEIPARYNTDTILTADVQQSGDRFTFELESAPPKKR